MQDKYKRLGKNSLLIFSGSIGSKLISVFMLPFYTKWLTVEEYGTTDLINVYVALLTSIVTCCIVDAIFIFPKNQSYEKQKQYFSTSFAFMCISLFVTLIAFFLLEKIFVIYDLLKSFRNNIWAIFAILFTSFGQQLIQQFIRSIDKILLYSLTGLIQTLFLALFAFLLIPKYNVEGYIAGIVLANIIAAIFAFICSKSYKYLSLKKIDKSCFSEMLRFSSPLIPNSLIWWVVGALNRPVIETYLGLHAIGIFAVANKFPTILTIVYNIFVQSWHISVLEEFNKKDYHQFYNKIFRITFVTLIIVLVIVVIFSKFLIKIFAAEDFYNAWIYIPVLILATFFTNISGIVGGNFMAAKNSKYYLYSSIIGCIVSIGFNLILIPVWGIMGASIAVLLSHAAIALSRIYLSWRYAKITKIWEYLLMFLPALSVIVFVLLDNLFLTIISLSISLATILIINKFILLKFKTIIKKYI
jgi:O-antigen/teichoic acid export membrane protein